MAGEIPSGEGSVFHFLDIYALGFGLEACAALFLGKSLWWVALGVIGSIFFHLLGTNWPRIKPRIGPRLASALELISSNRLYRRVIYSAIITAFLASVSIGIYRYFQNHLTPKAPPQQGPAEHPIATDNPYSKLSNLQLYFAASNGALRIKGVLDKGVATRRNIGNMREKVEAAPNTQYRQAAEDNLKMLENASYSGESEDFRNDCLKDTLALRAELLQRLGSGWEDQKVTKYLSHAIPENIDGDQMIYMIMEDLQKLADRVRLLKDL